MKYLTAVEYAELIGNPQGIANADQLRQVAEVIVRRAADLGLVLTVEQRSVTPLAMGRLLTDVQVREARKPA